MREILFRGKRTDNGEWCYGHLYKNYFGDWVIVNEKSRLIVNDKTIGQYTGLTDKNGRKIFEGDILARGNVVEYCDDSYCINGDVPLSYWAKRNCVVGNIHDNPELLRF